MLLGLRTAIYYVDDMSKAKDWYTSVLGFGPYFDQPYYVGFNVGGFELGLHPGEARAEQKSSASIAVYWGVKDAAAAWQRLLTLGATEHEQPQDVGEGIKVATVKDPFGNTFGIIENPNFKL